jgi:hypothetical protein
MKKLLCIMAAGALMLSANPAQAQYEESSGTTTVDSRKLRFGLYLAPTISWMRPTTDKTDDGQYAPSNDGSKIGFTYGLMAEYYFAENYGFVTGLQVNMTGGKINSKYLGTSATEVVTNADFNYRLNYLELPVALKLRTDPISGFRFFGQLGLTTGVNIAKKASYSVNYRDADGNTQLSTGNNEKIKGSLAIAPVMYAMNIGAGVERAVGDKLAVYAALFFNNGFAPDATNPNKFDMPYGLSFRDGNTRLNNFSLRLGLFF